MNKKIYLMLIFAFSCSNEKQSQQRQTITYGQAKVSDEDDANKKSDKLIVKASPLKPLNTKSENSRAGGSRGSQEETNRIVANIEQRIDPSASDEEITRMIMEEFQHPVVHEFPEHPSNSDAYQYQEEPVAHDSDIAEDTNHGEAVDPIDTDSTPASLQPDEPTLVAASSPEAVIPAVEDVKPAESTTPTQADLKARILLRLQEIRERTLTATTPQIPVAPPAPAPPPPTP